MEMKKKLAEKQGKSAKEAKARDDLAGELKQLEAMLTEVRCPAGTGLCDSLANAPGHPGRAPMACGP